MAITSRIDGIVEDSGAISLDGNISTTAGYATLAAGGLLATAVGTMVAPVPTLGLMTVGGGLVAAGKYHEIREFFSPKVPEMVSDITPGDVTEGGKYASPQDISDKAVPVVAN